MLDNIDTFEICPDCGGQGEVQCEKSEYVWNSEENLLERKSYYITISCPTCKR